MKVKRMEPQVEKLLTDVKALRDNDNALITAIWSSEINGRAGAELINGWELLTKISRGELSAAESITRCRRKVQEHNPELRGTKYKSRGEASDDVKSEIITWNNNNNQTILGD